MRDILSLLLRRPGAIFGVGVLALSVAGSLLVIATHAGDPWSMAGAPLSPPMADGFAAGTDMLGRDVTLQLAYGALVSLTVGLAASAAAIGIGILVGAAAGYGGGRLDDALMRFTEFFQTIPSFIFCVLIVAVFQPTVGVIVAAIAVVSWPPVARIVRAEFMTLREREFVQAARILGDGPLSIAFREILPNALAPIIALSSLMVASAILLEASLSFLGLGDPNLMTWGLMIGSGRSVLRIAWWMSVFPGAAIFLTVLALNLVGEALNDALNPRLSGRRET